MLKFVILLTSFTVILAQEDRQIFQKPKLYLTKENGEDVISALTDPFDGLAYRLPNDTKPVHYDIYIDTSIHKNESAFQGKVSILIDVINSTSEVVLHYRQTTIVNVDLLDAEKTIIERNVTVSSKDDVEFLIIKPSVPLEQGQQYIVEISYQGSLRTDNVGFYRSSYTDGEGKVIQLASTKFEPHNARHAFPCYDEPWIRATYSISIRHGKNFTAISNMPEELRSDDDDEYVVTKFQLLPSVQSYLVAFMISDLAYAEDKSTSVPHRVFAKPQSIANNEAELALYVSGKILDGFSEYFGVNYTLPKMDQVGFPTFVSGAMENWGMVTYREQYLIYDNARGTASGRENVMSIIAHEFTHQWTGNLVRYNLKLTFKWFNEITLSINSPQWWTYLWLNEGFAAFYENYILEFVFKNERWMDTFLIDTVQPVMITDANPTLRPMSFYVESPERVSSLFDSVAYSKSASVLRTFESALGADVWREAMGNYLSARKFNYAAPEHLHAEIQIVVNAQIADEQMRIDVDAAMKSWETQSGFPYVTVTRDGATLKFEQNRFMYADRSSSTNLWWIPINYYTSDFQNSGSLTADFWLPRSKMGEISNADVAKKFQTAKWLIVNTQQSFYYRVNYDENLWKGIIDQINASPTPIHILNRAQLIDDTFHFARANILEYDTLFWIMNYLRRETDYIPWAAANRAHTFINKRLSTGIITNYFQKFMRENVENLFKRLGVNSIEGEQRVDRYARNIAINIACYHQLEDCLSKTNEKLVNYFEEGVAIEADLTNVIFCNGMRKMDRTFFDKVVSTLMSSTSSPEKITILSNIDCIQDEDLYLESLMLSLNETLTAAERNRIIMNTPRNGKLLLPVYEKFVRDNFAALNNMAVLYTALNIIADQVSDPESFAYFVDEVLEKLQTEGVLTEAQVEQRTNSARLNYEWQRDFEAPIEEFFVKLNAETTTSSQSSSSSDSTVTITESSSTTTTDAAISNQVSAIVLMSILTIGIFV